MASIRRARGPRSVAEAAARVTEPLFRRRGLADGAILRDWETIVGPFLAGHTVPERIAWSADKGTGGTLHLRIANGALALELQHLEPVVVERVNAHFGYRAVARLRLVQGPLPERPPPPPPPPEATREQAAAVDAQLTGLDDPDLKDALARLGRALMARRQQTP